MVENDKKEYDKEVKRLKGKTNYDYKREKYVSIKPKRGFLATAVREFCSDLADVNRDDNNLSKNNCFKFHHTLFDKINLKKQG